MNWYRFGVCALVVFVAQAAVAGTLQVIVVDHRKRPGGGHGSRYRGVVTEPILLAWTRIASDGWDILRRLEDLLAGRLATAASECGQTEGP